MVDCAEFLDSYSDFRDGLLTSERRAAFEAHAKACDSCARYDRVVGGGVQVFRSLPALTPSPEFQARLLHRLRVTEAVADRHGSGASVAVTLMICLALGVGAWLPALRTDAAEPVRLPPIVAHAPYHDLTPVLMNAPVAPATVPAGLGRPLPAYYGQGLLLDQSTAFAALAYRPVSAYYGPR